VLCNSDPFGVKPGDQWLRVATLNSLGCQSIRWSGRARNTYRSVVEEWKGSGYVGDKDVVRKTIRTLVLDR
jgi:hypothetical protein